jgi:hypothetical protein
VQRGCCSMVQNRVTGILPTRLLAADPGHRVVRSPRPPCTLLVVSACSVYYVPRPAKKVLACIK